MKILSALGVLAGGFLVQPSPKAVASTLLWLTYGIYSAGIGDDQKRAIVDGVRLPCS